MTRLAIYTARLGAKGKCGTLWSVIIMNSEKVKAEQESKYRPLYTQTLCECPGHMATKPDHVINYGCVCVLMSVWEYICESVKKARVCFKVAYVFR